MIPVARLYSRVVGSRLFKASSIYMGGYTVKRAIPFLLLPVMTAHLTPEDYAVVSLFSIFIAIAVMMTGCGVLSSIPLEYINRKKDEFAVYTSNCLAIIALATGVIAGAAYLFSDALLSLFRIPEDWLWSVFVVAISTNILNMVFYTLQAAHRPVGFIVILLAMTVIEISVSLILVVGMDMHWQGRVLGLVLGVGLMVIPVLVWLHGQKSLFRPINPDYIRAALVFGLPLVPHYAGTLFSTMSDRLLLDHLATRTELGIYTVAFQLASVVYILIQTFLLAWSPWFYEHLKLAGAQANRRVVLLTYGFVGLCLVGGAIYGLCTWVLFRFMVDEAYAGGYHVAIVLSLAQSFIGLQLMLAGFITYARKTGVLASITVVTGLINLVLSFILIQTLGMMGAAIGTLVANGISFVVTWVVAARIHPMPWFGTRQEKETGV